jgi:hypothetical protein
VIDAQGWIDFALDSWGPDHKVNGGTNGLLGFVAHSAEGSEQGALNVLHGPRRASWHLTNCKDGRLLQHYSLLQQPWASGAAFPNNNLVSMELEGVAGEKMTPKQYDTTVRFLKDLMTFTGRTNPDRNLTDAITATDLVLAEHRECIIWGGPATACPSDRYPWSEIISGILPAPPPPPPVELHWADALWSAAAVAQHYRTNTKPHPLDMERAIALVEIMRKKT